ncbi:Kae1-associated kinase Bud32 [Candidatus Bathyarchaeota archaeon]|nr:Kae1-associated kinase Bud32 [Candidatus Bathyarchaeota archaeon]
MDTSNIVTQPFHRGAEAELFLANLDSWPTVVKRRIKKGYRNESLDRSIRRERTLTEANILHEAKAAGVRVPSIVGLETETDTLLMTHIDGNVARDSLDRMNLQDARKVFTLLGEQIGLLHSAGIVHGDLTTSNIIVTPSGDPFLVDFGMARRSSDPEDRGVDLHLLQRSIVTSHLRDSLVLVKALTRGYGKTAGNSILESSWRKAREIARRGRYFAIR